MKQRPSVPMYMALKVDCYAAVESGGILTDDAQVKTTHKGVLL